MVQTHNHTRRDIKARPQFLNKLHSSATRQDNISRKQCREYTSLRLNHQTPTSGYQKKNENPNHSQRALAWLTAPYPCIGLYMFLDLHMSQHPLYPDTLSRLNSTPTTRLLDVGCGLGQDVRKLVFDGGPADKIYAVELKAGLISAGHDLFMDGRKKGITLLQGDAVNDDISEWIKALNVGNGFDIIHTGALFHLFTWETQLTIAKNLVGLVHGKDDAVIFGWTFAARESGVRCVGPIKEGKVYGHNEESARRLWEEVGEVT